MWVSVHHESERHRERVAAPRVGRTVSSSAEHPHGGRVFVAAEQLGCDVSEVLDLSASLNPVAPEVTPIVASVARFAGSYPDDRIAVRALAAAIGVDRDLLVITNGASDAIALLAQLMPVGDVHDPEFSLYRRHLDEVRPGGSLWRSNPSCPYGRLAEPWESAAVWDESYYALATGAWTRGDAQAWRITSLTKLWSCPGLRLGFIVAPTPEQARQVAGIQSRWSVNGLAAASIEPLLQRTDLAGWATEIDRLRTELAAGLTARGLDVTMTEANWVLVHDAGLTDRLFTERVLVRELTSYGMPGDVRIAVPDDTGLMRLFDALDRTAR